MRCREERVILQRQSDAAVDAKATKRFECISRTGVFQKVAAGRFLSTRTVLFLTRAARLGIDFFLSLRVK